MQTDGLPAGLHVPAGLGRATQVRWRMCGGRILTLCGVLSREKLRLKQRWQLEQKLRNNKDLSNEEIELLTVGQEGEFRDLGGRRDR